MLTVYYENKERGGTNKMTKISDDEQCCPRDNKILQVMSVQKIPNHYFLHERHATHWGYISAITNVGNQ